MKRIKTDMDKLKPMQAVVVEGRDDVRAVQAACDALIIPTHGFGITAETWQVIDKAYKEKGIIIFTDPDHAGETIRKKIRDKYPDAVQAYLSREDATDGDDIGIENAAPEVIKEALSKALELADKSAKAEAEENKNYATISDLAELGLAGGQGASEKRAKVCKALGIGYGNASAMIKKLRGFGIDIDELKEATQKSI